MKPDCERFRTLVHERLDGELGPDDSSLLDSHLDACAACRAFVSELESVRDGLLALPEHPLPDAVLRAVLPLTTRKPRVAHGTWASFAAAAAVAAIVLGILWSRPGPLAPATPDAAELARARSQARYVLALAARAFHESERTARDRVVVGEVAPALRRVPVRWSEFAPARKL
jgi:anti-sigma factor RsiW